jgi:hypothetical protein
MIESLENYQEWIEHAKQHELKLVALIIEEIKNYDQFCNDFNYKFEIYKARFNPTGFDYFLWISDYFENFIDLIESLLKINISSVSEITFHFFINSDYLTFSFTVFNQ